MVSHLLTAIFTTGLLFNYQTYKIGKIFEDHGVQFIKQGKNLTEQATIVGAEGTKILQELQKPFIQKLVNEGSRNMDYLVNAKPFGIENGFVKGAVVGTTIGLAYYGYQKYQERLNSQIRENNSKN
jgi:hypothetical protein